MTSDSSKRAILTLPISPLEEPHIGLFYSPFVADVLARKTGLDLVVCLNTMGAKLPDSVERQEAVTGFCALMNELRIRPKHLWIDEDSTSSIQGRLAMLVASGNLCVEQRELIVCPCGKVELPAQSLRSPAPGKLYSLEENHRVVCRLCGGHGVQLQDRVLVFRPLHSFAYDVYPHFYLKELTAGQDIMQKSGVIVSRRRFTGLTASIGSFQFNIDVTLVGRHSWQR